MKGMVYPLIIAGIIGGVLLFKRKPAPEIVVVEPYDTTILYGNDDGGSFETGMYLGYADHQSYMGYDAEYGVLNGIFNFHLNGFNGINSYLNMFVYEYLGAPQLSIRAVDLEYVTTPATYEELLSLPLTTTEVLWTPSEVTESWVTTPEVSAILAELEGKYGQISNVIFVIGPTSESGYISVRTVDYAASYAPVLHIGG